MKELLGNNNEFGIVTEINEERIYNAMVKVIENKKIQGFYKRKIIERSKVISISQRMEALQVLF